MTAPETRPDETGDDPATQPRAAVTRRSVLRSLSLISGAGLVGGTALAGCTPDSPGGVATRGRPGDDDVHQPERPPLPPEEAPDEFRFLTDEEARLLEAVLARLAPGDDGDPGAVQMGVARYIDGKLADATYAEPTYTHGPFASAYEESPDEVERDQVPVAADQLYRYGYQDSRPPQDVYRLGLAALDRYAQTRFGRLFADLAPERRDGILVVLEDHGRRGEGDTVPTSDTVLDQAGEVFGAVDPGGFFAMVREDMIEGMFADPVYGGNRNLAGWQLIGWPGAQRSYSPQEMLHGTDKQPRPMHELPVMNPDRPGGGRQALERPRTGSGEG
ncbi:gluconate 2-dehydrogenase subunit 3 family protein [Myceligenerans salitolerans]|uniref:Gluconate 2-dehydrogenase subunit 3 family protein n=1 Tax=Myceligenerans salitolerans TaxID=1230528 RepID=A0ABS3I7V8_9MICO|nr:gluconate 2-dehydrogenase subunit 3 family protein [Myceligenerans salitolerans]MBO0609024.1 gluconate 2-dehydrogenase subunit 3 family protein [Myceligenerans salitolerans]